eukprot:gene10503-gene11359
MIRRNSSSEISPSPSRSASSIISCSSSSVMFSPSSLATRFRFRNEILPVSSSSKSRNAFKISSRESRSLIFAVIISKNSEKSMVPEPSLSMSEIIFLISSFFGSKPRALIATFNSLASMVPTNNREIQQEVQNDECSEEFEQRQRVDSVPDPSVSNRSKASRISCFCSSVSSNFFPLAAPFFAV